MEDIHEQAAQNYASHDRQQQIQPGFEADPAPDATVEHPTETDEQTADDGQIQSHASPYQQYEAPTPAYGDVETDNDAPAQNKTELPTTPTSTEPASSVDDAWREVSKTTTIPMQFTPSHKAVDLTEVQQAAGKQEPTNALPFDREAALAAIAYRRGRAKSFAQSNGTPRKPVVSRAMDRRDISAPVVTS